MFPVLNNILNAFVMSKFRIKTSRVHFNILWAHEIVSQKNNMFYVVCKKTNIGAKKAFNEFFLSFSQPVKNVGIAWNLGYTHTMSRYSHQISVWNFRYSKLFFPTGRSICSHVPKLISSYAHV